MKKNRNLLLKLFRRSKNFHTVSYSQEGEDRIIETLFGFLQIHNGFYIDIGAHHPFRFSNTYKLYMKGWRGINIDVNQDAIHLFNQFRPRDINLAIGVGEIEQPQLFYVFDEPALSTFNYDLAIDITKRTEYKIINELMINIVPLSKILDNYLPNNQHIDLLSVDVEGSDLAVLKSNNWNKHIPSFIIAEIHSKIDKLEGFSFSEILNSDISQFLQLKGYEPFAKTLNSIFYKYLK